MLEPRAVNTFEKYRAFKQHLRGYTKAVEFCAASDEPRRPCSAIDLNILRTSRQIYEEAFHILWTANAFMFHQPATFRKFTGSLSVAQRHTLARVYIIASIDYRANQAYCWDRELGAHLAKKLPALQRLAVHLKLKADPWRCPWIDLNDFHTSSTINALSCLQEVPKIKLKVSLDRNYDTTRFMFPNRLFDDPTSPYHRLINTKEGSGTVFFLHDDDLMMVLEVFYEAFILNQPDVDDVKAEYEAEILARQPVAAFAMKRGPEIWLGITPRRLGLGFEF